MVDALTSAVLLRLGSMRCEIGRRFDGDYRACCDECHVNEYHSHRLRNYSSESTTPLQNTGIQETHIGGKTERRLAIQNTIQNTASRIRPSTVARFCGNVQSKYWGQTVSFFESWSNKMFVEQQANMSLGAY